jgi:hypothetical protein
MVIPDYTSPWSSLKPRRPHGYLVTLDDAGLRLTTIWITLAGTIELEGPAALRRTRYAEATLVQSRVGSLSIPGWLLTSTMGAHGASLL